MARNFYFGKEAGIVSGSANFASLIAIEYASLGLTSEQAVAFGALNAALQSSYSASIEPSTRTPVAVAKKNLDLVNMRRSAMVLSTIIVATPSVDDAQLLALGLLPRAPRTRRQVPGAAPVVQVISVSGRLVKLRVREAASQRRGLPFGAAAAHLYSFVGEEAPTDPRQYHFHATTTRALTQLQFPDSVVSGATVWLSARWVSARGQVSASSPPMSFTLQGGAIVPNANSLTIDPAMRAAA